MKIYVGNLSYDVSESDLEQAFSEFGPVTSVNILKDKDTGQSKGFGFVEMSDAEQGKAAIKELNGKELNGRQIKVDEAQSKPARPRRGGFGGGPRGGGGGGGGRRRFGGSGGGGNRREGGGNRREGGGGGGRNRY